MSNTQKKIGLKAIEMVFTPFSIVYIVEPVVEVNKGLYPVYCNNNIKSKDLILKPTIYENKKNEVIFCPSNVTPHFYQSIHNGTISNHKEYLVEMNQIYKVGDIVGYIVI